MSECAGDIDDIEVEPMPDCKHCPEPDDDEPDYYAPKPLTPLENYNQNDEHNVH